MTRRALISVSDKTGLEAFGRALVDRGFEIISTGGTAAALADAGMPVREVAEYTGFPEIMDGRVKTLHPKIHGGILGRRGIDDTVMREHGIEPIDIVTVNLYPFARTVARPDCGFDEAVEQIDIGGPAILRSAAKNHDAVTVIVDPADYDVVIDAVDASGGEIASGLRRRLAAKAFEHTAAYDATIGGWLGRQGHGVRREGFPPVHTLTLNKLGDLRYGENPHQRAALYLDPAAAEPGIATATQVLGKPLSFNNIVDADAALECVRGFTEPACVIVKHANPCGAAVAENLRDAYELAYRTDPDAAFGGIIAFNRPLDAATARAIVERQFVEVVVAPDAGDEAHTAIASRKHVRLLLCGEPDAARVPALDYKSISGGMLVQERDLTGLDPASLDVVTKREPTGPELRDLEFAWKVARFVKSNAIVLGRDNATIGIGAGQMSRVYSARIAALKAADGGLALEGAVMASDAFFPFRDGIDTAAAAGITAVIQPGGSKRDAEVIAAADEHGMAMVFTGIRHFRH